MPTTSESGTRHERPRANFPLCGGDHLSRAEFERRFAAMPGLKKAELIEGEVHMPSPVSADHAEPHARLSAWLGTYAAYTPGVRAASDMTVRLDGVNEYQPDALLRVDPSRGGRTRTSAEGYVEGGPELVAEVAASTVSMDLHKKLKAYERNGVREYLVVRTRDEAIDWLVQRDGELRPGGPGADGILRSEAFPGLWLDAAALLRGDMARVLAVLQQGLASPAHATFVEDLARAPRS